VPSLIRLALLSLTRRESRGRRIRVLSVPDKIDCRSHGSTPVVMSTQDRRPQRTAFNCTTLNCSVVDLIPLSQPAAVAFYWLPRLGCSLMPGCCVIPSKSKARGDAQSQSPPSDFSHVTSQVSISRVS